MRPIVCKHTNYNKGTHTTSERTFRGSKHNNKHVHNSKHTSNITTYFFFFFRLLSQLCESTNHTRNRSEKTQEIEVRKHNKSQLPQLLKHFAVDFISYRKNSQDIEERNRKNRSEKTYQLLKTSTLSPIPSHIATIFSYYTSIRIRSQLHFSKSTLNSKF